MRVMLLTALLLLTACAAPPRPQAPPARDYLAWLEYGQ